VRATDYARAATNLRNFLDAFNAMLREFEPVNDGFDRYSTWVPRPGREAQATAGRATAAARSGPAARAFDTAGVSISYKPAGTMQQYPVNPALVWSSLFDDPMLDPSVLQQVALQALGLLEDLAEVQAQREKGFIGAIAWFFTLAPRIRQAAGLEPHTPSGAVVQSVVVFFQGILIATIGGALVFPLVDALGWLPEG